MKKLNVKKLNVKTSEKIIEIILAAIAVALIFEIVANVIVDIQHNKTATESKETVTESYETIVEFTDNQAADLGGYYLDNTDEWYANLETGARDNLVICRDNANDTYIVSNLEFTGSRTKDGNNYQLLVMILEHKDDEVTGIYVSLTGKRNGEPVGYVTRYTGDMIPKEYRSIADVAKRQTTECYLKKVVNN